MPDSTIAIRAGGSSPDEHAARAAETLLRPHAALAALVDGARREARLERVDQRAAQPRRAGRQELTDQHVAVAIDDDAGRAVALPVHETVARRCRPARRATQCQRLVDAPGDELGSIASSSSVSTRTAIDVRGFGVPGRHEAAAGRRRRAPARPALRRRAPTRSRPRRSTDARRAPGLRDRA